MFGPAAARPNVTTGGIVRIIDKPVLSAVSGGAVIQALALAPQSADPGPSSRSLSLVEKGLDVEPENDVSAALESSMSNSSPMFSGIGSVEWVVVNSPLDQNPHLGGGLRIFPDKTSPTDGLNRKEVRVRVVVAPAQAGTTVYLKAFDVDDPSSNQVPVDDEAKLTDNRGPAHTTLAATQTVTTDANGVAVASFRVTMQPGNNFRVVASLDQAPLNGVKAIQNDGVDAGLKDAQNNRVPTRQASNLRMLATPLLTVWRRLWVEVDDMAPVAGNNNPEDDFLTNGQEVPRPDVSRLPGLLGQGQPPVALGEAYIKPIVDAPGVGTPEGNFPFVLNVERQLGVDPVFASLETYWQSHTLNNQDFWVAYILGAFQGKSDADNDPESEMAERGWTYEMGGSLIFIEASRDRALDFNEKPAEREQNVVIHEVGHALTGSEEHPVTVSDVAQMGVPIKFQYTSQYLDKIRSIDKPRADASNP